MSNVHWHRCPECLGKGEWLVTTQDFGRAFSEVITCEGPCGGSGLVRHDHPSPPLSSYSETVRERTV